MTLRNYSVTTGMTFLMLFNGFELPFPSLISKFLMASALLLCQLQLGGTLFRTEDASETWNIFQHGKINNSLLFL